MTALERRHQDQDPIRVLLYVQLKRRDTFPMKKIAAELSKIDRYSVRLCGTSDFPYAVLAFRPQIVVFGKPDNAEGDWLRCMSGCTIVSLNPEQGGDNQERVLSNFLDKLNSERDQAFDLVDHHLIVDEQTRSFLTPYIKPERMHVVGYPRLIEKTYARKATPVGDKIVIGVACGDDIIEKESLLNCFELYQERGFEPWSSIEAMITSDVLEYLWINSIVSMLKSRYQVIVRYRHGNDTYLFDESSVELDKSETLEYLFSAIDLLIVGRSTVAIEALMVGIPSVTVSSLFRLGNGDVGTKNLRIPLLLWQPNSVTELVEMVDRRSRNGLELAPDVPAYEAAIKKDYFCGEEVDNSIERILDVIQRCDPGTGAVLDLKQFRKLLMPSLLQRMLLFVASRVSSTLAHRAAIVYCRIRARLAPDAHLLHGVFVPEFSHGA